MTPDQASRIRQFHRDQAPMPAWLCETIAEDLVTFGYQPPSRGELRALHIEWILYGTPGLVFPPGVPSAPLTAELLEVAAAFPRSHDGDRRRILAIRARRIWARLVEMAVGIRVEVGHGYMGICELRDA